MKSVTTTMPVLQPFQHARNASCSELNTQC